jgi:hypothetical protein
MQLILSHMEVLARKCCYVNFHYLILIHSHEILLSHSYLKIWFGSHQGLKYYLHAKIKELINLEISTEHINRSILTTSMLRHNFYCIFWRKGCLILIGSRDCAFVLLSLSNVKQFHTVYLSLLNLVGKEMAKETRQILEFTRNWLKKDGRS